MKKCKSFQPVINFNSKILILGSMPGIQSLEKQEYYAYPQNRFWRVMAFLCHCSELQDFDYNKKLEIILNNNYALWDVIASCERQGSLDTNIVKEVPNKIPKLLKNYPNIDTIYLNGTKAFSALKKYFPELLLQYHCRKLPSTSPANAKFKLKDLYELWKM